MTLVPPGMLGFYSAFCFSCDFLATLSLSKLLFDFFLLVFPLAVLSMIHEVDEILTQQRILPTLSIVLGDLDILRRQLYITPQRIEKKS